MTVGRYFLKSFELIKIEINEEKLLWLKCMEQVQQKEEFYCSIFISTLQIINLMYLPSSQNKKKDYEINQNTNNTQKREFFRSSLRSREDLAFLKYRDEGNRYDVKVRDTISKPDLSKYISQTTKNSQQFGKYFKNRQGKEKPQTGLPGNKSLDKKFPKNQQTSTKKVTQQNKKPENTQYQKLHDKLNYLQGKISQMRNNLQKKREEKKKYFDQEIQERKDREERDKIYHHEKEKEKGKKWKDSLKELVTQVPYKKQLKKFEFDPYSPRNNLYYVSEIVKAYKQEKSLAREHLVNSINLLKMLGRSRIPSKEQISARLINLEKKHPDRKTVIFDLDETLIHCNENINMPYDIKLPIKFPTGEVIEAGINVRPYAKEILKHLSKNFQIIVFTASHSCYANVVINYLDPENKYISHRLFREHCYPTGEGIYVKDLRVINRDLSQTVLVDNAAYSYAFQVDNGIPIIPFYEGKNDYQLKALQGFLELLMFAKDVRDFNKNRFKIHKYVEYDNCETLVKELYGQYLK